MSISVLNVQNRLVNIYAKRQNSTSNKQGDVNKVSFRPVPDKVSFGSYPENFAEVVTGKLFRGAKPSRADLEALRDNKALKHVVDLFGVGGEKEVVQGLGMNYVHIELPGLDSMKTLTLKIQEAAVKIKELMQDGPVYVHCLLGQERTGYVIAGYQKLAENLPDAQIIQHAGRHAPEGFSVDTLLLFIEIMGVKI